MPEFENGHENTTAAKDYEDKNGLSSEHHFHRQWQHVGGPGGADEEDLGTGHENPAHGFFLAPPPSRYQYRKDPSITGAHHNNHTGAPLLSRKSVDKMKVTSKILGVESSK